jgi:hypothetical protein
VGCQSGDVARLIPRKKLPRGDNGMRGRKIIQNDVQVLRSVFLPGDCLIMLGDPVAVSYCELLVV